MENRKKSDQSISTASTTSKDMAAHSEEYIKKAEKKEHSSAFQCILK